MYRFSLALGSRIVLVSSHAETSRRRYATGSELRHRHGGPRALDQSTVGEPGPTAGHEGLSAPCFSGTEGKGRRWRGGREERAEPPGIQNLEFLPGEVRSIVKPVALPPGRAKACDMARPLFPARKARR